MNRDLPTPVSAKAIFNDLLVRPPLVILLKKSRSNGIFLQSDDKNHISLHNHSDNHVQCDYQTH